jgi:squalene-hopene/tetraprenyl-beta-curcumene cyclase
MLPSRVVTALADAISRAQANLLSRQAADGHWVGELEADRALTAEYLLLRHLIDRVDRSLEQKAVNYLRRRQSPDGGWALFEGGPSDLSATIKIYFAMKLAGVPVDDRAMVAARKRIQDMGGPTKANVFAKILLALFGEYDWNGVPTMPAEIMLLPPPFFLFNIYEVSYWSRCVIVPLLIIMDR